MAATFLNLPTLAADGAGTPVDVSAQAAAKTIVNAGNGGVLEPIVTIEVSNDAAAANWAPVYTFSGGPGEETIQVAAWWIRAVVSNYRGGGAPNVDCGADSDTAAFATLVATAGNGSGASVSTATLGQFKSIVVADAFRGTVNIEIREDAAAGWATIMSFQAPGVQSAFFTAQFMRVTRTGVPTVAPGLPVVYIAADTGGTGGGGISGIDVQEEGVPLAGNPYGTLNFVGAGVTATDGGAVATITVPGAEVDLGLQAFQYTVTGVEPDTSNLTIALPAARANAAYLVMSSQEEAANILGQCVATASKTVAQFVLSLSSTATAGDIFSFSVLDPT